MFFCSVSSSSSRVGSGELQRSWFSLGMGRWLYQEMQQLLQRETSMEATSFPRTEAQKGVTSWVTVTLQCHQEYYLYCFASVEIPYDPSRLQPHVHLSQKIEGFKPRKGTGPFIVCSS